MANVGLAGQNALNVVGGPTVTGSTAGTGADAALAVGVGASLTDKVDSVVRATFDKAIQWKLRWEPMYRNFATRRPVDVAFPGSKVTMFRAGSAQIALATTPLNEYEDPDAKAIPGALESVDLTMNEYGDASVTTLRLRERAWTQIDPLQAEYVARGMRDTTDAIYLNTIYGSTGGFANTGFMSYKGDAAGAISTTAVAAAGAQSLQAGHIRRIVALFRNKGQSPFGDGFYLGLITPDISVALRETTDVAGWRYPHLEDNANGNIWNGTVGIFEGVRFIESPQYRGLDKGSTVNVSTSLVLQKPASATAANVLFLANEGLVEGVVREPGVVTTPQNDKFGRLFGIGWYGWFGTSIYDGESGVLFDVKNG
jgi:N4-gp56 family major capsid protein